MEKVAGLDVHGKQCTFVVQASDGTVTDRGEFETTSAAIGKFVRDHSLGDCRVGLETGVMSSFVAQALARTGAKPVIIDATEVRRKARSKKQKSDSRDAFEICDGLRRDIFVGIVTLPPPLYRSMRRLLSMRRHFVRARSRALTAIRMLLRSEGLAHLLTVKKVRDDKALRKLQTHPELSDELRAAVGRFRLTWLAAHKQVQACEVELDGLAQQCADAFGRLQTIPGVGPIVALTGLAFFFEPERFESAKHAASYAGLVPQTYNSGDVERFGHITGRGPSELRTMLVESALHARKTGHPFHAFYRRIAKKRGHKLATVAVAHKLARVMWSILRHECDFDPARHLSPAWDELASVAA